MAKIVNLDEGSKNSKASSAVKIFENEFFGNVKVILRGREPWFVGRDIALILGYSNTNDAINTHVDDSDRELVQLSDIQDPRVSLPSNQKGSKIVIINESGLYSLILSSRLESAKRFKRWVTSEVLPSIREYGIYSMIKKNSDELRLTEMELSVREKEISLKELEILERLGSRVTIPEYKQIVDHYIMERITGDSNAIPLPELAEQTYSAEEIGQMVGGLSANMVGRIANKHGLKTPEYGKVFLDKSRHSNKEVQTFRYFKNVVDKIKEFI